MKNNHPPGRAGRPLGALMLLVAGCARLPARAPEPFQGVLEHDESYLGFEVPGRLAELRVARGDVVEAGAVLATLDDSLARPLREARREELRAARARVALLRAGPRPEELRVLEAQLRGLRSTEALLERNAARQRGLAARGSATPVAVDELETQLARTRAERDALEQRLRALRAGARREEVAVAEAASAAAAQALEAEEQRLARYVLRARVKGTVLDLHFDPGEVVAAGTPIVTVADTRHPYADVFVPQGALANVRVGTHATLRVDAARTSFSGRVEDVSRRTEFTPRFLFSERERPNLVVRVRVRVDDPGERLHAGVPVFVLLGGGS